MPLGPQILRTRKSLGNKYNFGLFVKCQAADFSVNLSPSRANMNNPRLSPPPPTLPPRPQAQIEERDSTLKYPHIIWEHSSHLRLIGRGVLAVSLIKVCLSGVPFIKVCLFKSASHVCRDMGSSSLWIQARPATPTPPKGATPRTRPPSSREPTSRGHPTNSSRSSTWEAHSSRPGAMQVEGAGSGVGSWKVSRRRAGGGSESSRRHPLRCVFLYGGVPCLCGRQDVS